MVNDGNSATIYLSRKRNFIVEILMISDLERKNVSGSAGTIRSKDLNVASTLIFLSVFLFVFLLHISLHFYLSLSLQLLFKTWWKTWLPTNFTAYSFNHEMKLIWYFSSIKSKNLMVGKLAHLSTLATPHSSRWFIGMDSSDQFGLD